MKIFDEIINELDNQDELKEKGKFLYVLKDSDTLFPMSEKLCVLAEEFGEVSKEVTEKIIHDGMCKKDGNSLGCTDPTHIVRLRKELIQLAACCVGWIECIDEKTERK